MRYLHGTITRSELRPMVEIVPSVFYFWIDLPELGIEMMFQDEGSIKNLSLKYGFIIEGEHAWDLTPVTGRECIVSQSDDGFKFVAFRE